MGVPCVVWFAYLCLIWSGLCGVVVMVGVVVGGWVGGGCLKVAVFM